MLNEAQQKKINDSYDILRLAAKMSKLYYQAPLILTYSGGKDSDVWDFIHDRKMKYNPLYDKGYSRVGCVGCPLSSEKLKEFADYPKYKENYIKAFQRMVDGRNAKGKHLDSKYSKMWKDGESVFAWWIEDKQIPGQLMFDEDGNITEYKP